MATKAKAGGKPKTPAADAGNGAADLAEKMAQDLEKAKTDVNAEREERNFFMLERDRINQFWEITKKELDDAKALVRVREQELESQEEKHQVEIKVYKQKVKHLLYEYQNSVASIQAASEQAAKLTNEQADSKSGQLVEDKRALRLELKELELSHADVIKSLQIQHDIAISSLRADFERQSKELYTRYERNAKQSREELELRRKTEIHEIEERKNNQVNNLMRNHEKAFAEMKNYYNDITTNSLALIASLKEQVADLKKNSERQAIQLAETTAENKRLLDPLTAAQAQVESLRRQLTNYAKDKASLASAKNQCKSLETKNKDFAWENEVLHQRVLKAEKDREQIFEQFVGRVREIKQKSGFKNLVLEQKISSLMTNLELRDTQLNEILSSLHLDPSAVSRVNNKLEKTMSQKNALIKELQWELEKTAKAHNDLMKTYEAKLTEFSLPTDDFGIRPLQLNEQMLRDRPVVQQERTSPQHASSHIAQHLAQPTDYIPQPPQQQRPVSRPTSAARPHSAALPKIESQSARPITREVTSVTPVPAEAPVLAAPTPVSAAQFADSGISPSLTPVVLPDQLPEVAPTADLEQEIARLSRQASAVLHDASAPASPLYNTVTEEAVSANDASRVPRSEALEQEASPEAETFTPLAAEAATIENQ